MKGLIQERSGKTMKRNPAPIFCGCSFLSESFWQSQLCFVLRHWSCLISSLKKLAVKQANQAFLPVGMEIYLPMAQELQVEPEECLVGEDSLNGIKAALAAGTNPIAVVNNFTRDTVIASGILPQRELIIRPENVLETAKRVIEEKNNE